METHVVQDGVQPLQERVGSQVDRWEYKLIYFSAERWTRTHLPSDLNEKFDQYGAEGWELVGTESIVRPSLLIFGAKTVGIIGYFKRGIGQ
jgi:hypothetical protein